MNSKGGRDANYADRSDVRFGDVGGRALRAWETFGTGIQVVSACNRAQHRSGRRRLHLDGDMGSLVSRASAVARWRLRLLAGRDDWLRRDNVHLLLVAPGAPRESVSLALGASGPSQRFQTRGGHELLQASDRDLHQWRPLA